MRMQKEEKIVVVLLFMAIGSLAVAGWAFSPDESSNAASSKDESGISLEGVVTEMAPTKTGGHLIIKLDSTEMPVFVSRDCGSADLQHKVKTGDRIRVRGMVEEFGGAQELKVGRAGDVEVL